MLKTASLQEHINQQMDHMHQEGTLKPEHIIQSPSHQR